MKATKPHTINYFPLGKAEGAAFCNRTDETAWLLANIEATQPSLLIAPRRFGKSSLANHALAASALPHLTLNFNTCTDEEDVDALIRQGIGQLLTTTMGSIDKLLHTAKNYLKSLTPKITVGPASIVLELSANQKTNAAQRVEESLRLLEKMLAQKKQAAVLLLDEFEIVGVIAKGHGVEAALRNAAQDNKHLILIFSGSHRRLLKTMFEDENRPLYKLCRKLPLTRIAPKHYIPHFNKAALQQWQEKLSPETIGAILEFSQRHPYYVNYLCGVLWAKHKQIPPTVSDIEIAWQQVVAEEASDVHAELSLLSLGQKKLLKYIVHYPQAHFKGTLAIKDLGMALSSITTALTALQEKDIIEKDETGMQIINPVLKSILSTNSNPGLL